MVVRPEQFAQHFTAIVRLPGTSLLSCVVAPVDHAHVPPVCRLMSTELKLYHYSLEACVAAVMRRRVPFISQAVMTTWFAAGHAGKSKGCHCTDSTDSTEQRVPLHRQHRQHLASQYFERHVADGVVVLLQADAGAACRGCVRVLRLCWTCWTCSTSPDAPRSLRGRMGSTSSASSTGEASPRVLQPSVRTDQHMCGAHGRPTRVTQPIRSHPQYTTHNDNVFCVLGDHLVLLCIQLCIVPATGAASTGSRACWCAWPTARTTWPSHPPRSR